MKRILFWLAFLLLAHSPSWAQNYEDSQETPELLGSCGVFYLADFKGAGEGYYGIKADVWRPQNYWGVTFSIGANFGLVDKDYSSVYFALGPVGVYHITKPLYAVCPLRFHGAVWTGKDSNQEGSNFAWGFDAAPGVMVAVKKWCFQAAIDLGWTKGVKRLSTGFEVGIGYDF